MKKIFEVGIVLLTVILLLLCSITATATEVSEIVSGNGDVNMDNEINSSDMVYLRNYFLGETDTTVTVDVNNDGNIDARDIVRVKKILASVVSDNWVDTELGEQGSHDIF